MWAWQAEYYMQWYCFTSYDPDMITLESFNNLQYLYDEWYNAHPNMCKFDFLPFKHFV